MGLITRLDVGVGPSLLAGPLLEPLVIRDEGDAWGTECRRYRAVAGRFRPVAKGLRVIADGPVRTITESRLVCGKSRIVCHTIGYRRWPVLEVRLRIHWNEERRMLKLALPTSLRRSSLLVEVPGGAIARPADGDEHVFGRWAVVEGETAAGARHALAVIGGGQHGLDFFRGELRLSVLRSAAYCHERNFRLAASPARKYMDQGVHDVRLLVTAGSPAAVLDRVSGLADWLSAPPWAVAHLPFSHASPDNEIAAPGLLTLSSPGVRLTCLKRSTDGRALILRLHETRGEATSARLEIHQPRVLIQAPLRSFEIKTLRLEKSGSWREVDLVSERGRR
jgi:alpha-mannosidase